MILIHQISQELMMGGYKERELILKRFIFRKTGKVFVYQSSVPDEIYETPVEERSRDIVRYTQVMELWCFEVIGGDVVLSLISQINLRNSHNAVALQYYNNGMPERC